MAYDPNTDPFQGRGVRLPGGEWVPSDHPLASQAAPKAAAAAPAAAQPGTPHTPPNIAPGTPGANNIETQGANAQTYSNTPGAAPLANSTNQGTQDTVRNSYLKMATQPATVDVNDPAVRQQADTFAAGVNRSKDQYLAQTAERASARGLGDSGAMDLERRIASERAGMQIGGFEADLIGRELTNRRSEIQQALGSLSGMLDADMAASLQRELAQLDAQLKRLGIESGANIAGQELGLKRDLGFGNLNLDALRLAQNDRQFADSLGLDVANSQAQWDNARLRALMDKN